MEVYLGFGCLNSLLLCDYLDKDCRRTHSGVEYQGNLTRLKDGNETCSGPCRNMNVYWHQGLSCEIKDENGSTKRELCDIPFCGTYTIKSLLHDSDRYGKLYGSVLEKKIMSEFTKHWFSKRLCLQVLFYISTN